MMNRILVAAAGVLVFSGYTAFANLNPENRWQVRDFYNAVYLSADSVEIGWTGNYANGQRGTVSPEWQTATRHRVNFFREMAGIPADVTFDPALDEAAQQAALMMSSAGQLSHTPGPSWPWYTQAGADAAAKGNLALGSAGPEAITGYISDFGGFNAGVGHRRWLLYPHTSVMGNGDVPGDTDQGLQAANVLWVIPNSFGERPPTRDEFVAWPPRGHVPATLVFARWSFAYPGADFSNATVSMQSGGQSIPVTLEPYDGRFIGEPTLVWVPNGMDTNAKIHWPVPESDETIDVTVSNVLIDGTPTSFSYTVRIVDPNLPGEAESPAVPVATGPVIPTVPAAFTVSSRDWSEGVQGRIIEAVPYSTVLGAEAGLADFHADLSPGYSGIQNSRVASGSSAFHLATPDHSKAQTLLFKDEFIIRPGPAELSFASSLAWATGVQVASVEINTGSGDAWQTIWSLSGPVDANTAFSNGSIDLTPWEGKTARFRFRYKVDALGSYWANVDGNFGWAIDDITLTGVSRVTRISELPANMGSDSITVTFEDAQPVFLQSRDLAFDGRPLDWGPITAVHPAPHTEVVSTQGQWVEDPVIGWNFGSENAWTHVLNLGWAYVPHFPWIYTSEGWSYHHRGSVQSGLWLYNTEYGYIYTSSAFGNWFQHAPFDESSWKRFGG